MKFLSQSQKEVIAKTHGITVESINKRIELWSLINDPDISKTDLVEAQKAWIKIQQGTSVSYTHLTLPTIYSV